MLTKSKSELGLKLWATNTYYNDAINSLWNNKIFDYIELYVVPETCEYIKFWAKKEIPYVIHCAHSKHGFNLSIKDREKNNKILFKEAIEYFDKLKANYLILHPGVMGDLNETIRQLKLLLKENNIEDTTKILVENKPLITLNDEPCIGSSPEDILLIKSNCNTGFCLDIIHCIKYSIGKNLAQNIILNKFMNIKPDIIHISDAFTNHLKDEHLHLGEGNLNFKEIFSICKARYITLETEKNSKNSLSDFEKDIIHLKEILKND